MKLLHWLLRKAGVRDVLSEPLSNEPYELKVNSIWRKGDRMVFVCTLIYPKKP